MQDRAGARFPYPKTASEFTGLLRQGVQQFVKAQVGDLALLSGGHDKLQQAKAGNTEDA